jgi:hypothetical protein
MRGPARAKDSPPHGPPSMVRPFVDVDNLLAIPSSIR